MKLLTVIGMGPGEIDYILPAAVKAIKQADVIAAGARHMEALDKLGETSQERILINKNLGQVLEEIVISLKKGKKAAVCVSGDPGYYSMLNYLKAELTTKDLEGDLIELKTIPGLSSVSYLFSRLNLPYQNASLLSLHGREVDVKKEVENNPLCAFLTDPSHGLAYIAEKISSLNDLELIVGENLSYENEKITFLTPEQAKSYQPDELNIILVKRKENHEAI